jgi:asparagine synthetase B (glutamine-hydrolysing)|tara:strand:- start:2475 stop:3296 length:822 start_codon:yes stop_codon:yes gene_type:complete
MINKLLENIIQKERNENNDIAVLLSGGVDSNTCLFTSYKLGLSVHGYSFHIEGNPTYDSLKAQEVCEKFNIPFTSVAVPIDNLVEDFKMMAYEMNCKKKVHFECTWPFLYMFPKIKEKVVISGVAADGHYGLSKKAMIHFKHTKEKFDKFRTDYFKIDNPAGVRQLELLSKKYDKIFIAPYLNKEVFDYFIQFDWDGINKPYEKHLIRQHYPEFDELKLKKHLNLQLVADIPIIFEKLLDNREINLYNRKRIMDVCRDWSNIVQSKGTLESFI